MSLFLSAQSQVTHCCQILLTSLSACDVSTHTAVPPLAADDAHQSTSGTEWSHSRYKSLTTACFCRHKQYSLSVSTLQLLLLLLLILCVSSCLTGTFHTLITRYDELISGPHKHVSNLQSTIFYSLHTLPNNSVTVRLHVPVLAVTLRLHVLVLAVTVRLHILVLAVTLRTTCTSAGCDSETTRTSAGCDIRIKCSQQLPSPHTQLWVLGLTGVQLICQGSSWGNH